MEEIIKELKEISEAMFDEKLYAWSDQIDEIINKVKAESNRLEQTIPKIAEEKEKEGIRRLAEITYSQLAVEFMVMAGYKREKAEYLKSLYARKEGFDVEDMQIIPIIEKALWEAKNSNCGTGMSSYEPAARLDNSNTQLLAHQNYMQTVGFDCKIEIGIKNGEVVSLQWGQLFDGEKEILPLLEKYLMDAMRFYLKGKGQMKRLTLKNLSDFYKGIIREWKRGA